MVRTLHVEQTCLKTISNVCSISDVLIGLLFGPEAGSELFLRIVSCLSTDYTVLCSRICSSLRNLGCVIFLQDIKQDSNAAKHRLHSMQDIANREKCSRKAGQTVGKGKDEQKDRLTVFYSVPVPRLGVNPSPVFVTGKKARRWFVTSVNSFSVKIFVPPHYVRNLSC
jgi:hypothetical protein